MKLLDVTQMKNRKTDKEKQDFINSYYRVFVEGRIWSGLVMFGFVILFVIIMAYQNSDDPSLPSWFVGFIYWLKGILN